MDQLINLKPANFCETVIDVMRINYAPGKSTLSIVIFFCGCKDVNFFGECPVQS